VHRRVRRFLRALAVIAMVVIVAAACSSDGFPVGYDDQIDPETQLSNVEANWMEGCQPSLTDELADSATTICQCSFDRIKAQIPFEDFVEANDRLADNPEILANLEADTNATERQIVEIVRDCIAEA
jgi:hypothetical protein